MVLQTVNRRTAGSGTSRSTTTSSASASWRRSTISSRGAAGTSRPISEEVERCPAVKDRVAKATRVTGYFATRDYSYRAKEVAGDGWVLVGDAFGFLDPLYSSGRAAGAEVGRDGGGRDRRRAGARDVSEAQLGKWGAGFNDGVDRMRRLVCEYYNGFSFGAFVRSIPELRGTVTDLLIGDLFTTARRQGVGADGVAVRAGPPDRFPPGTQGAAPEAGRGQGQSSSCCRTAGRPVGVNLGSEARVTGCEPRLRTTNALDTLSDIYYKEVQWRATISADSNTFCCWRSCGWATTPMA